MLIEKQSLTGLACSISHGAAYVVIGAAYVVIGAAYVVGIAAETDPPPITIGAAETDPPGTVVTGAAYVGIGIGAAGIGDSKWWVPP